MTNEIFYPGTSEYRGYTIEVRQDEINESPRKDFDHLATMVCEHSRYNLGDGDMSLLVNELQSDPRWKDSYDDPDGRWYIDTSNPSEVLDLAERWGYELMDLFLYDHSGLSMSTSRFSCPWDSGQVGVIYVSPEKMRKEWSVDRLTNAVREKVRRLMESEVETYDQYLQGDVWGFNITDPEGEDMDGCWGFYGLEYMSQEIASTIDHDIERRATEEAEQKERERKASLAQLKLWIRNHVPLEVREQRMQAGF